MELFWSILAALVWVSIVIGLGVWAMNTSFNSTPKALAIGTIDAIFIAASVAGFVSYFHCGGY